MTEEWLQEAKSLEESEEKQSWWTERKSLGSLDTWREEEEGEVSFIMVLITYIHTLKSSNTPNLITERYLERELNVRAT